jgi:lambda repressor-like predicted transcriptional regulator
MCREEWETAKLDRPFPASQKLVATGILRRPADISASSFRTPQAVLSAKKRIQNALICAYFALKRA